MFAKANIYYELEHTINVDFLFFKKSGCNSPLSSSKTFPSPPEESLYPQTVTSLSPDPNPQQLPVCFLSVWTCLFPYKWACNVAFCVRLLSLGIMFSGFHHAIAVPFPPPSCDSVIVHWVDCVDVPHFVVQFIYLIYIWAVSIFWLFGIVLP